MATVVKPRVGCWMVTATDWMRCVVSEGELPTPVAAGFAFCATSWNSAWPLHEGRLTSLRPVRREFASSMNITVSPLPLTVSFPKLPLVHVVDVLGKESNLTPQMREAPDSQASFAPEAVLWFTGMNVVK